MLDLIFDPKLYLLFVTVYVVGFVDPEERTGRRDTWGHISTLCFWAALGLAVAMFALHGTVAGTVSLMGAWASGITGVRRGIIAQHNSFYESLFWTTPLPVLVAIAMARKAAEQTTKRVTAPRPRRMRIVPQQLPTIADLLPTRGKRLTIMGIAMDMAACVAVFSGLAMVLR